MPTVNAEIKRLLRHKDQKILDGQTAIGLILANLRKQVLAELNTVSGEGYAVYQLQQNRAMLERAMLEFEVLASREIGNQLGIAWNAGGDLLSQAAAVGELRIGMTYLPQAQLQVLKDASFYRIKSLSNAAWDKINGELVMGMLGQKTPQQVTQAIAGSLDSPGVFKSIELRAETITKLEMGRAYSAATHLSIKQAAASVPGLQKEWWHAGHPKRPRINHVRLHGQRKPVDQPFIVGSVIIDHPRDPKAPLSEVIGCGCDLVPWHPDWDKQSLPKPGLIDNRDIRSRPS